MAKPTRKVVDSRGIWCPPTPLTDLFKAWKEAKLGEVIELRATEPNIETDVRAWARKSGNRILEASQEKGYTKIVVQITKRGKEFAELSTMKTNMMEPDEVKLTPKGKLQLVTLGGFTFGLRTLEPGWKWTTHMQPIMNTETCQIRHIGYVISGRMGFLMDYGATVEVGAGDAFDVKPGHDAWTVGNEPVVFLDLIGAVSK
jgi:TusA-related sulfurtransferase